MKMKEFNLEEYLKNPSMKVVTRKGTPVRIVCTDFGNESYPIIGEFQDEKERYPRIFTDKGKYLKEISKDHDFDLFFAPEKKVGWVNLYKSKEELYPGKVIYSTKEEAADIGKQLDDYITTAEIEWEE